jgi:hypothetical protein
VVAAEAGSQVEEEAAAEAAEANVLDLFLLYLLD